MKNKSDANDKRIPYYNVTHYKETQTGGRAPVCIPLVISSKVIIVTA